MALRSFLLQAGTSSEDLSQAALRLFPYSEKTHRWESSGAIIYSNGQDAMEPPGRASGSEYFLVNEPPEVFDEISPDDVDGAMKKITQGAAIIFSGDKIRVFNGPLAAMPIYYCTSQQEVLISTEIKSLLAQDLIPSAGPDPSWFDKQPYFKPRGSNPVNGIHRLQPNTLLEIDLRTCRIHLRALQRPAAPISNGFWDNLNRLYRNLNENVVNGVTKGNFGIPLSGGCDSGAVAGIAAKHYKGFHTFTMGTAERNEFKEARLMSDFIGSKHHEVLIPEEDLLPAILHGIFLNELTDAEYAIGYAGLYFTYRAASGIVDRLLTGYGADLTLSNFLNVPEAEWKESTENLLFRTSQTGELGPFVSMHFGLDVAHPFLDPVISDHIQSMPADYKIRTVDSKVIEKYIEKELIQRYGLMPDELVHRNKKALHTGAGINELFHRLTGSDPKHSDKFKSGYLYGAWKQLIFDGIHPEDCDLDLILFEANHF